MTHSINNTTVSCDACVNGFYRSTNDSSAECIEGSIANCEIYN